MSTSRKTSAAQKKTPAPRPEAKTPTKTSVHTIGLEEIKALILANVKETLLADGHSRDEVDAVVWGK